MPVITERCRANSSDEDSLFAWSSSSRPERIAKFGSTTPAIKPMIMTTASSSISVKPRRERGR